MKNKDMALVLQLLLNRISEHKVIDPGTPGVRDLGRIIDAIKRAPHEICGAPAEQQATPAGVPETQSAKE